MEPRKICQLACKGQARSQTLQGPLTPGDPHPVGKEGLLEGSWLTNFLPLSCWPRKLGDGSLVTISEKDSHTPRISALGQGKGLNGRIQAKHPRQGRDASIRP